MVVEKVEQYWKAITVIEAQNALVEFKIAEFPWAKQQRKEVLLRQFKKLAYDIGDSTPSKKMSIDDFENHLKAGLNG